MSQVLEKDDVAKVLIVEDRKSMAEALRFALPKSYRIEIALDGEKGLALANRFHPHLTMVDILLPGISGIDVLKYLPEVSPQTVPIVVSVVNDTETKIEAVRAGAQDYLVKGFEEGDLRKSVRMALEKWPLAKRDGFYSDGDFQSGVITERTSKQASFVNLPNIGDGNELAMRFSLSSFEWWHAFQGFLTKIALIILAKYDYEGKLSYDDVLSDFYEVLLKSTYRPILLFDKAKGSFRNWLGIIIKTLVFKALKRFDLRSFPSVDDLKEEPSSQDYDPLKYLEMEESYKLLRSGLLQLSRDERVALEMKYGDISSDGESSRKDSERTKRRKRKAGLINLRSILKKTLSIDEP